MAQFELPDVGEGLTEAEIVSWKVRPGDTVDVNDPLVEIETAKSLVELPSPYAGTVRALLVEEGQTVPVGTPIVDVDAPDMAQAASSPPAADAPDTGPGSPSGRSAVLVGYGPRPPRRRRHRTRPEQPAAALNDAFSTGHDVGLPVAPPPPPHEIAAVAARPPTREAPSALVGPFPDAEPEPQESPQRHPLAKPPVRRLARDLGIALRDVTATGPGGTVTRADVERAASTEHGEHDIGADAVGWDGRARVERVKVRSVRRATARAVTSSAFSAPHVTQFVTVDVTASMELLERLREHPRFAGTRVSPLTLAARAMAAAVRHTPEVNAAWDEEAEEIVLRRYVHLGVATATPRGLLVPVVRNVDQLSLVDLAAAIAGVTEKARHGRTTPRETSGGTVSITNIGVFGMDAGTPIIAPGQSAILALGQVARRPWVVEAEGAECVVPRWVTTLGLSFDHRLVDGAQASSFLNDVADALRDPAMSWALT